jgi:hypothetical protein
MVSPSNLPLRLVEPDKRGRVMSFYLMAFLGITSFGSLFTGSLITLIGISPEVALSGGVCLLIAFWFARKIPKLRQIVRVTYPTLIIREQRINNKKL